MWADRGATTANAPKSPVGLVSETGCGRNTELGRTSMTMRIAQRYADKILAQVLQWRRAIAADVDLLNKPNDVNRLLALFERVSIQKG
jgi:hypothetical protein